MFLFIGEAVYFLCIVGFGVLDAGLRSALKVLSRKGRAGQTCLIVDAVEFIWHGIGVYEFPVNTGQDFINAIIGGEAQRLLKFRCMLEHRICQFPRNNHAYTLANCYICKIQRSNIITLRRQNSGKQTQTNPPIHLQRNTHSKISQQNRTEPLNSRSPGIDRCAGVVLSRLPLPTPQTLAKAARAEVTPGGRPKEPAPPGFLSVLSPRYSARVARLPSIRYIVVHRKGARKKTATQNNFFSFYRYRYVYGACNEALGSRLARRAESERRPD